MCANRLARKQSFRYRKSKVMQTLEGGSEMQAYGMPRHSTGGVRRDALRRWRKARKTGLSAAQAADAVGVPVSTLYRWTKQPVPRSRAPHTRRQRTWKPETIREVERLRQDHPMWGKAKIGPILRKTGHDVSDSTVGRILAHLVKRGAVQPVAHAARSSV